MKSTISVATGDVRILALVTHAFGGRGGIAQFNRDFLRALSASGLCGAIDVHPRLDDGSAGNDLVLNQRVPVFGKIAYAFRALRTALMDRPEVVISGHLFHGQLAHIVARLSGAKLISILHGTEIWKPLKAGHLKALKASDLVICVSEDTRNRFLAQAGDSVANRAVVLHNTFEDRFSPVDAAGRRAARARFDLDELPVVLTVGRLDTRGGYKGHDKVFPVIKNLKDAGRPARYLIAGEGEDRARLEALVDKLKLGDVVRFLGYVPDDDMPDLYRAADVFAMPSSGEGFGIVFIEAMACGTPAIGLNVGGASEALVGLGLAVRDADFAVEVEALIAAPRPVGLSERVREKFGKRTFNHNVKLLLETSLVPDPENLRRSPVGTA